MRREGKVPGECGGTACPCYAIIQGEICVGGQLRWRPVTAPIAPHALVGDRHPILALLCGIERAIEPRRLDEFRDDEIYPNYLGSWNSLSTKCSGTRSNCSLQLSSCGGMC
jgi:hypothetical protein